MKAVKMTFCPCNDYCYISAEFNKKDDENVLSFDMFDIPQFDSSNLLDLQSWPINHKKNISMVLKNQGSILNTENFVKCVNSVFSKDQGKFESEFDKRNNDVLSLIIQQQ